MPQLPEVQYNAGMPGPGSARQRLQGEVRQAADTLERGLASMAQEVVKTRSAKASADLAEGLSAIETGINSRRYIHAEEIRQELGADFESLPPEVKGRLTEKVFDIPSGQFVDKDRKDIPMWEVASAIFDAKARRLVEASGQNIPGSWADAWREGARDDVLARKQRVAQIQSAQFQETQRNEQAQTINRLVNAGEFGTARAAIGAFTMWSPDEKGKLLATVDHAQQVQPFEDLVLRGIHSTADVVQAGKYIGQLERGDGLEQVDTKERIQRKGELEKLVAGYEREVKYAQDHAFDKLDGAALDNVTNALIAAKGRPLPFALIPKRGAASPKMREHLYGIIERTQKQADGGGPDTDPVTYQGLNELARNDVAGFLKTDVAQIFRDGKLSLGDFKKFSDLQRTLKAEGKDSAYYQSFVGPQEYTNFRLLERGVHTSGDKVGDDERKIAGYIQIRVNRELDAETARLKRRLTVPEQEQVVDRVITQEWKTRKWRSDAFTAAQVDPLDPQVNLKRAARRAGQPDSGKEFEAFVADYAGATDSVVQAWRGLSPRPILQDDAIAIFQLMRREQKGIDEALKKQQVVPNDADRARLAAAAYLRNGTR